MTLTAWQRTRQVGVQWIFDIAGPFHINGALVLLPFIQADFDLTRAAVAWAVVVYYLSTASFILVGAYLGNTIGRRKVVLVGVAVDCIAQFGIFLVAPFWGLVLFRLMGGFGNALIVPNLSPLTVSSFAPEKRGQALGVIALGLGIGILLSTVVAGRMADTLGWRYLFLLTGSMYAVLFVGALAFVRESPVVESLRGAMRRLDYRGLILMAAFLIALSLGMQRLGQSISDPLGLVLAGSAIPLAMTFVYVERRHAAALVPMELFAAPGFSAAVARFLAMAMTRSSHIFLLPFYLIQGLGWSGTFAGTVQMAFSAGQPVFGPISGTLADRVGTRGFIITAQILMALGTLALLLLGSAPAPILVVAALSLIGAAMGMFIPPNLKVIFDAVPPDKMSLAPGVQVLTGHASNAIGSSFMAMLLTLFLAGDGDITAAYRNALLVVLVGFVTAVSAIWLLLPHGARKGQEGEA